MISSALRRALQATLAEAGITDAAITDARPLAGGCISQTATVGLADGKQFFVKWSNGTDAEMFACEARGLKLLDACGVLRVPRVIAVGDTDSGERFLLSEYIESGNKPDGFFENLGRKLAEMHRRCSGEKFGLDHDNFLGATPQPNSFRNRWVDFWRDNRLAYQLELANRHGLLEPELVRSGRVLLDRLEALLGNDEEPASLLHGDLWGGNYLVASSGEPVLIDPAAYYGHREAELAMMRLFGGFPESCFRAYHDAWPLQDGHETRLPLYQLYHLLNHLNLFGRSYLPACRDILMKYTR